MNDKVAKTGRYKERRRGTLIDVRGTIYPSMSEAARQLGVSVTTIYGALERGTLDTCGLPDKHAGYLDGVWYPSKVAAARTLGITGQGLHRRIQRSKMTWVPAPAGDKP